MKNKKQPILVLFGGESSEHEVSIVTGLQALEHVDTDAYEPHVVYISKQGEFLYLPALTSRKNFFKTKRISIVFGKDAGGGYIKTNEMVPKTIRPYAALLAFHGGLGEGGALQGLLEACAIPFSSAGTEGSVIAMNKSLARAVVSKCGASVAPGVTLYSNQITEDIEHAAQRVIKDVGLPVIVKPVHFGSSIGISIARSDAELDRALMEAARVDSEILVEKFLEDIVEYNCAVREVDGNLEVSEIERPVSKDVILSFADKYQRGGKSAGGMASLSRELPAKISDDLKKQIQETAKKVFRACRLKGMARIDFMLADDTLYFTEVNPIPGSLSFYLWEASGIPYQEQITTMLEEAVCSQKSAADRKLDYTSDIVERFVEEEKGG